MAKGFKKNKIKKYLTEKNPSASRQLLLLLILPLFLTACSELEKPKPETFYAETYPPAKQEFRWSNGKMPKSFDPAKASAPPETDIVRAIYDGLTEIEPKALKAIPAIAHKWSSSEDYKTWTFELRQDAKWSNGEKVTAKDFVRSWKRLAEMGEEVSHHELLKNIVGMKSVKESEQIFKDSDTEVFRCRTRHRRTSKEKIKRSSRIWRLIKRKRNPSRQLTKTKKIRP